MKKKKKKKKEEGELERSKFGGSVRLQKWKEVKKEKCQGTCVEEKKKRKKGKKKRKRNVVHVWRIKKEGKKRKKKRKGKWYHNIFTILSQ